MNKIAIIGAGSVGSTIAYTLTITGLASEIVMIDINHDKAVGEAMDIRQGTPFCSPVSIYAGSYSDAVGANIVIVTCGIPRKAGQSRLDLAQVNVNVTKGLIPEITKYAPDATYIIVSNPVDILTYTFCKCSGLPENRIIGSGTILDTSRLRNCLSEYYRISQENVHAYVMGEHGDSSFIPWSLANIANVPIKEFRNSMLDIGDSYPSLNVEEVEQYVKKSGSKIIQCKGATFYAVSASVAHICESLARGIDTTMTVSTMMHGEYDVDDVCLSVLNIVGHNGAHTKVHTPLTDEETAKLRASAASLKSVIAGLDI